VPHHFSGFNFLLNKDNEFFNTNNKIDIFINMLRTKILIKENQLKRLLLLTEADKRNVIIDKIGWSKEWANEFHNLSDKYSVWIADSFLTHISNITEWGRDITLEKFNSQRPENNHSWSIGDKSRYEYILDWLRAPRREQIDLKSLTFDNAYKKAREWHLSLKVKYDEKNEFIIDYRNNKGVGFYWVNLDKSYCSEEAQRMGHCGRGKGKLFSLRNINEFAEGQSFITVDYNNGVTKDFKASGNQKPSDKYHKYIIDLLIQRKYPIIQLSNEGHEPEKSFKLKDLTKEQIDYVFSKNPTLRFDINSSESLPYIVDAILDDEISFEMYDLKNQLRLIRASKKNPILIKKFSNQINNFGDILSFNENDTKLVLEITKDKLKRKLSKIIDSGNFTDFLHSLRDISTIVYGNNTKIIDIFCKTLDKGFNKFGDKKEEILRTRGISKQLFKCASNFELINKYQFGGRPNKYDQIIAIGGKKGNEWGVIDLNGNIVIEFIYDSIGLKASGEYMCKRKDGGWDIISSTGELINSL
jgi:hypothetical protein